MSTSASESGAIIVLREYEPVRKESLTVIPASMTSRTFCWRVETVDAWRPVISRFSLSLENACKIDVAMCLTGLFVVRGSTSRSQGTNHALLWAR